MEIAKKIVLLGQFGVGKTSISRRFIENLFDHDYLPTLGVQIKKKMIQMPSGNELSMIIWDLEGFSKVSKTRSSYLLGTNGFVYVFDITRPFTYAKLDVDVAYLKSKYPKIPLEIIGNKKDLENSSIAELYLTKKAVEVTSFVSAKTGEGVAEIFTRLAKRLIS
jgi:small GTP-binding protein